MKILLHRIAVIVLSMLPFSTMAGPVLDSYWPLNDGDQRLFSVRGIPLTMSDANSGDGYFSVTSTFAGSSEELDFEETSDGIYLTAENAVGPTISFDTPVTYLTDSLLQKGGTVKTETTIDNGLASAIITVTVANAGTVTVPAGTFTRCKSIVTRTKVASQSSSVYVASSSFGPATTIVAPGIGPIKALVLPGVWAVLENATIAGAPIGKTNVFPINLQVNGTGEVLFKPVKGAVSSSVLLQMGSTYTAIAKPLEGGAFEQWTDGQGNTLSTSPDLTFTMESNLVLQANFETNPYLAVAGRYIGIFYPGPYFGDGTNTLKNSGYITVTVNTKGNFSGYWQTGAVRHTLSGHLDGYLDYTNTYNATGEGAVTVGLSLGDGFSTGSINGNTWSSSISLFPVVDVINYEGAGRYRIQLTSDDSEASGTAIANFANKGPAVITGTLPGGPRFSATSTFTDSSNAQWPFYTALYAGKGYLLGLVEIAPGNGGADYSSFAAYGNFIWLQPDGIVTQLTVSGTQTVAAKANE